MDQMEFIVFVVPPLKELRSPVDVSPTGQASDIWMEVQHYRQHHRQARMQPEKLLSRIL